MQFLQQWTETSAFFIWLRESTSIWAYPTVFFLHTIGLVFTAGVSIIIDARLLGAARDLPVAPLGKYFRAVWIGFWLTVASGAIMLLSDLQTKLANQLFPIKMVFVAGALVLLVLLRRRISASNVSPLTRALAALSLVCWLGAIVAGRFMAYLQ